MDPSAADDIECRAWQVGEIEAGLAELDAGEGIDGPEAEPRFARLIGRGGTVFATATPLRHDAAMSTAGTIPSGVAERERVLGILRRQRAELRARGVRRLALFGSVARGEAAPGSDVDLLAEIDHTTVRFSLLDLIRLEDDLAKALGRPVEVVTAWDQLRPRTQARLRRDLIEIP